LVRRTHSSVSSHMTALLRHRPLMACSRTGLVNNANDAFAWALVPLLLAHSGRSTAEIATVAATYPLVWGLLQLVTGPLSDRIGRRVPVVTGMFLQALALASFTMADDLGSSIGASALLGLGTALAYPALIAAAADVAPSGRRAAAVGFFRMWRDAGYVAGALGFGLVADAWGFRTAALVVAVVTAASGLDAMIHLIVNQSSEQLKRRTMAA
jgi:MFS family permease